MSEANAIQTTKPAFDLSPQTFEQALAFSQYLADSELVPKNFRGKPGDCLIAMQWGYDVGLKPLQALQNISVINGKPGLYGDAGKAILLAAGCIIDEDDIEIVQRNGKARCKITRPGRPPVERTYSLENAKTAGLWGKEGPWKTGPYRQMAWRAFWFAARDAAADMLKGLAGAEEVQDIPEAPTPKSIDPDTGEITPKATSTSSALLEQAEAAASMGVETYNAFWSATGKENRKALANDHERLKKVATSADSKRTVEAGPTEKAPAAKSFDEVMTLLCEAKALDALYVAGDLITQITNPEEVTMLSAKFDERKAVLEGDAS